MRPTGRDWKRRAILVFSFSSILPVWGELPAPLHLTLEQSRSLAVERNEDLRMARQDLQKARQQIREARAAALPQIDLSSDYTRNWKLPTFVFETPSGTQEVEIGTRHEMVDVLSLRQALYTSGKVGAALEVARLFERSAAEQVRAVRQRILTEVEIAFYDLLLAQDLLRVSRQAVERARENLGQVERLRRAGRTVEYDLLRARVQVSEAQSDSVAAQNRLDLAEMKFESLLGLDLEQPIELEGSFRTGTMLPLEQVEELVRLGAEQRSELRQIRYRIEMLSRATRIARAGARPSIELSARGQVQVQGDGLDLWNETTRRSLSTGLGLKIPLFDGFRTRALVEQARLDEEQARLSLTRLRRSVALQIRQAWLNLRGAEARLSARNSLLEQAEEGARLAGSRYERGRGTYLEVLDAQLLLTQARAGQVRARRDRAAALVRLEAAVGSIGEQGGNGPERERTRR